MKPLMPPIGTVDNIFHDGNPATGVEGTVVTAEHLNNSQDIIRDTQSELIAILTAASLAPASTAGQLLAALKKLFLDASLNGSDIADKAAFLSNLGLSNAVEGDTCSVVGFVSGDELHPYLRHKIKDIIIRLATRSDLNNLQPKDATLTALAGLVGAANKIAYFNGTDTAALADLSAFIRVMLGKSDAGEVQSYLNLVPQSAQSDATTGRLMKVGAFGLGSSDPLGGLLDGIKKAGFYKVSVPLGGLNGDAASLVIPYDSNTGFQLLIPSTVSGAPKIYFRTQNLQGSNGGICQVYTDANTTKAADGTLKAASPIVRIFSDGRVKINEESEGCTVARQGVGEYLIKGCMGLNADAAWGGIDGGFDVPKDRNRQPLIWLDYEVNPDGSILVKTYHRTYPDAPEFAQNKVGHKNDDGSFTETVMNGAPIDIPADQFVSVRVEMPADSIYNQNLAASMKAIEDAEHEQAE